VGKVLAVLERGLEVLALLAAALAVTLALVALAVREAREQRLRRGTD
jgi:hypothetical protein